MNTLLVPESPLCILPTLAKKIGLNEAIVVQQLHYLLLQPSCGRTIEGIKWVFNTYEEWQSSYFPFWSISTIERVFRQLETMAILETCQPDGRGSRRKYYRLNEDMKMKLLSGDIPDKNPDHVKLTPSAPDHVKLTPSAPDHVKLTPSEHVKLTPSFNSIDYTKTTGAPALVLESEGFDKKILNGHAHLPPVLSQIPDFSDAWKEFVEARKKKRVPLTPRAAKTILNRLSEQPGNALAALDAILEYGWTSFEWGWSKLQEKLKTTKEPVNGELQARFTTFLAAHPNALIREKTPTNYLQASRDGTINWVVSEFHRWMRTNKYEHN